MASLAFKQRYVEPILTGRKVSTLRKVSRLQPGDEVAAKCSWTAPPFARLRVHEVDTVALDLLTEQDADAEGFESVEDMRAALHDLYPGVTEFVRIRFSREPTSGT